MPTQPSNLINLPKSYKWTQDSTDEFQKAMSSEHIQTLLDTFLDTTYTHSKEGVNLAVKHINYLFKKTAQLAQLKQTKTKTKTTRRQLV